MAHKKTSKEQFNLAHSKLKLKIVSNTTSNQTNAIMPVSSVDNFASNVLKNLAPVSTNLIFLDYLVLNYSVCADKTFIYKTK